MQLVKASHPSERSQAPNDRTGVFGMRELSAADLVPARLLKPPADICLGHAGQEQSLRYDAPPTVALAGRSR